MDLVARYAIWVGMRLLREFASEHQSQRGCVMGFGGAFSLDGVGSCSYIPVRQRQPALPVSDVQFLGLEHGIMMYFFSGQRFVVDTSTALMPELCRA